MHNKKEGVVRPIVKLGSPCLRKRAQEVRRLSVPKIQHIIEDLKATCAAEKGMGMAAPQIGQSVRIILIASRKNVCYPHAPTVKPFVLINPEWSPRTSETEIGWEACLSLPGLRAKVSRHSSIDVVYTTEEGNRKCVELKGFLARILQHEIDHLNGIFFFERADQSTFMSEEEFQKLVAAGKV